MAKIYVGQRSSISDVTERVNSTIIPYWKRSEVIWVERVQLKRARYTDVRRPERKR